jgi:hypothetical protein
MLNGVMAGVCAFSFGTRLEILGVADRDSLESRVSPGVPGAESAHPSQINKMTHPNMVYDTFKMTATSVMFTTLLLFVTDRRGPRT